MVSDTIPRFLSARLGERLGLFPAVALLGPRQVGKTTLARAFAEAEETREPRSVRKGLYLDLENPVDREKLADARGYLATKRDRLVVLDEIHRAPHLFQTLRGVIDERIRGGEPVGQFLLLGSASMDLLRQSGESLVDGCAKAPISGEHKIWGLTSWHDVFSQVGRLAAGSSLPAMNTRCVRTLRRVTRRAGAQRRSRAAA